jgi:hypothetical protein
MRLVTVIITALLIFGCSSRVPLTKGLIKDYGLSINDITKLQLYVSDDILLEKHQKKIDKNIDSTDYSLKKVEDYYVNQIIFAKETPCIAGSAAPDKLSVAFEHPGDYLIFISNPHNERAFYYYKPDRRLLHDTVFSRPSDAGYGNWKTIGDETYSDTLYSVLIKNEMPFLMVDKSSLKNFILDARKVKGVKQSELNRL